MANTILIRQMLTDDVPYVARFHHAAWVEAHRELLPKEDMERITLRHFQKTWHLILQDIERTNLIALEKAMPVGYASYLPHKKIGRWELAGLYVDPSAMNKGCGTALFTAVLEAVKAEEATRLVTWVMRGNERAIHFYQKHGMYLTGKNREVIQEEIAFEEIQLELRWDESKIDTIH